MGTVIFTLTAQRLKNFNPDDAALGRFTSGIVGTFNSMLVSDTVNIAGLKPAWDTFKKQGHHVVLIIGASQLHSINHLKSTDRLAVMVMNEEAARRGLKLRFLQLSRPNGNFNDMLAQYLTFIARVGTPDALLISVTYDDLREPGIQEASYVDLPPIRTHLAQNGGRGIRQIIDEQNKSKSTPSNNSSSSKPALKTTDIESKKLPHDVLENFIVNKFESLFSSFKLRGKVSAYMEWATLDTISRFTRRASYRRAPDIPEQYRAWNLAALDSLFKVTAINSTKLLFFQAPHPQGLPTFYHDRQDYDHFHGALASRCKQANIPYIDLETLVPLKYWGMANGGLPDTFHFKGEGHELLGQALLKFIVENSHAF